MKELIKELTEAYGPSGDEANIGNIIFEKIKPFADYISFDKMGNLIARKVGPNDKIMLSAHMDEIGVIVTSIDENGFLRFSNIGGLSPFTLIGERVLFKNGTIGVFGKEKLDNIKDLKFNKMYIDIGVSSKEEALEKVNIGDAASFYRICDMSSNYIISKSLDNRVGCAILIQVLKQLKQTKYDTYFVFTVQEEVGLRGAKTATFGINPDLAISVDVTPTGDTPEAPKKAIDLSKGPAIKIIDRSIICHPKVREQLITAAKQRNIPYQLEVTETGGTDVGAIHVTRAGIPSGGISIPCRYIHTSSEMVHLKDIKRSVDLLLAVLQD